MASLPGRDAEVLVGGSWRLLVFESGLVVVCGWSAIPRVSVVRLSDSTPATPDYADVECFRA